MAGFGSYSQSYSKDICRENGMVFRRKKEALIPKWFFSRETFIEQLQFTILYKLLGTLRDIRHLLFPHGAHLLVARD